MTTTHHEIRLAATVSGATSPSREHFQLIEVPKPTVGAGQVLVRNRWMTVSAAMRTLMGDSPVPMPMYTVGNTLHGPAIGEVVESDDPAHPVGTWVRHRFGWREFAVVAQPEQISPAMGAEDAAVWLGQGLTAYVGLRVAADVRPGDTVLVTGAAGAVGASAGQIARLLGAARVVGTSGKPDLLPSLGYDVAVARSEPERLRAAAPDGFDVVFDTVGGPLLAHALELTRPGARVALCGALAHQLAGESATVPINVMTLIGRRVTVRGFTASDHDAARDQWARHSSEWRETGRLRFPHVSIDGLAGAPGALIDLIAGRHHGTVLVGLP